MNLIPDGNCASIVDAYQMMGPISVGEMASLEKCGGDHRKHWRVITALKVCDNCPLSDFRKCYEQFFDQPGIRAGEYLSREEVAAGKVRGESKWQSGSSAPATAA